MYEVICIRFNNERVTTVLKPPSNVSKSYVSVPYVGGGSMWLGNLSHHDNKDIIMIVTDLSD